MIKVNEYIHLEDDIVLHFKFIEIKSFLSSTKIIWGFEIKVIIIKNVYFTNYAFIYDYFFVSKLKIGYNKMSKITLKLETPNDD